MLYRCKLIQCISGVDFRAAGDGVVQKLDSLPAVVADDVPLP